MEIIAPFRSWFRAVPNFTLIVIERKIPMNGLMKTLLLSLEFCIKDGLAAKRGRVSGIS